MSQLSSGGRKSRPKAEKIDWKQILIFLAIFALICIIITVICIFNTKRSRKSLISDVANKAETTNAEKIELKEKYFTNGLKAEEKKYKGGDLVERFEGDAEEIYEYEMTYQIISGLKNKNIQDKINKDIEDKVNSCKTLLEENPNFERISIYSYISANFSNVLSIRIDYSLIKTGNVAENIESAYEAGSLGLNYRLDTGKQLKFDDLFFQNTNIKNIINMSCYEAYAWEHSRNSELDFYGDLNNSDYGYIENQTFKILAEYNKNPDIDFYFTPKSIFAIIKDFVFEIDMQKYSEDIAIYTSYASTQNLYEDDSIKKEFFAFTEAAITDSLEVENTRGDNFYYEILTYPTVEPELEDVKAKAQEKIDEKLQHYYELAESNPEIGYLISIVYYFSKDSTTGNKYYQYDGYVTTTDIDYFKNHKDELIAKVRREPTVDLWSYDFSAFDENIEYFEEFSGSTEDYNIEPEETIITKEDREANIL